MFPSAITVPVDSGLPSQQKETGQIEQASRRLMTYALAFLLLTSVIIQGWRSLKLGQEKKRLQQIMREKEREMEEKNRRLETQAVEFFSQVSHEFRSHLTLIMLPLEHLLEDCRDKEQEERLDLILQNSQQLLTLINRLPHLYGRFFQERTRHESL
jgi:signal transduction histidine kinase